MEMNTIEEYELPLGDVDTVICLSFEPPCLSCGGVLIRVCPGCEKRKRIS